MSTHIDTSEVYMINFTSYGENKIFYGTFGSNQLFPMGAVRISAKELIIARQAMFHCFNDKFCTVYTEEEFVNSQAKFEFKAPICMDIMVHPLIPHKPLEITKVRTYSNFFGF